MKVLRCHDCGEMPEVAQCQESGDWYVECPCLGESPDPITWNAIQRRKRMGMAFELVCAIQAWETDCEPVGGEWFWAENLLAQKFGPADGEEVDHD